MSRGDRHAVIGEVPTLLYVTKAYAAAAITSLPVPILLLLSVLMGKFFWRLLRVRRTFTLSRTTF